VKGAGSFLGDAASKVPLVEQATTSFRQLCLLAESKNEGSRASQDDNEARNRMIVPYMQDEPGNLHGVPDPLIPRSLFSHLHHGSPPQLMGRLISTAQAKLMQAQIDMAAHKEKWIAERSKQETNDAREQEYRRLGQGKKCFLAGDEDGWEKAEVRNLGRPSYHNPDLMFPRMKPAQQPAEQPTQQRAGTTMRRPGQGMSAEELAALNEQFRRGDLTMIFNGEKPLRKQMDRANRCRGSTQPVAKPSTWETIGSSRPRQE